MIDYIKIAKSIEYYQSKGFQRIESPWTVTKSISDITKPENGTDWTIQEKNKVLVASGEQSFLYLYNKGFLPNGKFQTITPCFRDEPFDEIHTKYFIKNELIITDNIDLNKLLDLVKISMTFFESYLGKNTILIENMSEINGYDSYDLTYKDIELGSYGIRKCDFLTWIYGTALAEPRLTRVMKKYGIS